MPPVRRAPESLVAPVDSKEPAFLLEELELVAPVEKKEPACLLEEPSLLDSLPALAEHLLG